MNSKERVKSAIHFKNPDKIPVFNILKGDIASLPIGNASTPTNTEENAKPNKIVFGLVLNSKS